MNSQNFVISVFVFLVFPMLLSCGPRNIDQTRRPVEEGPPDEKTRSPASDYADINVPENPELDGRILLRASFHSKEGVTQYLNLEVNDSGNIRELEHGRQIGIAECQVPSSVTKGFKCRLAKLSVKIDQQFTWYLQIDRPGECVFTSLRTDSGAPVLDADLLQITRYTAFDSTLANIFAFWQIAPVATNTPVSPTLEDYTYRLGSYLVARFKLPTTMPSGEKVWHITAHVNGAGPAGETLLAVVSSSRFSNGTTALSQIQLSCPSLLDTAL
jgi:hypothetical protein